MSKKHQYRSTSKFWTLTLSQHQLSMMLWNKSKDVSLTSSWQKSKCHSCQTVVVEKLCLAQKFPEPLHKKIEKKALEKMFAYTFPTLRWENGNPLDGGFNYPMRLTSGMEQQQIMGSITIPLNCCRIRPSSTKSLHKFDQSQFECHNFCRISTHSFEHAGRSWKLKLSPQKRNMSYLKPSLTI